MLKLIIYAFVMIASVMPAGAQQYPGKSAYELKQLLQKSKRDSNRILILQQLGGTYFSDTFSPERMRRMDTAIEIFNHAIRLSDTLHLEKTRSYSMLLAGEAYCWRGNLREGKNRIIEVASIYRKEGNIGQEAYTWLALACCLKGLKRLKDDSIPVYFEKAILLYKQAQNITMEVDARTELADYLYQSSKYSQAEKELLYVLNLLYRSGSNKVANVYYFLSLTNRYRAAYEKSLSYAIKCVQNAERYNDTAIVDMYYGELALIYDELGHAEESSQWYRKTLEVRIYRKEDPVILFRTAGFLIRQLIKLNKSRYALILMDSLVALGAPRTTFEKGIVSQNLAYCFDALQQYATAEQYFLSMITYFRNATLDPETTGLGNMDIGRFYLKRGQFKKARTYLDSALVYRSDNRLSDQKELFQMLFNADSALGNYSAAIKDLQQYQFLNDSIYNERKSRQIEELAIQYETEKKQHSIRLLENEKRLQQNKLTKEQNTKRWISGVALLLIIIIGLLVNYSRLKQRTNRKLLVQQKQIEHKNDSLQHLVEEKEWLVREIHHRVKNNFNIVMGLLGTQTAYLQGEEAIQAVDESRQRIQAMSLVHQKLYQSDNLSAINMADYIYELTDYLKDSFHTGHTIRFNLQIEPVKLNVSHCIPLGLILNEAITNSIKHAFTGKKERTITISFKRGAKDHYLLSVRDNGIGLPAAFDITNKASMGMKLMRGLSDDLDATFEVKNNGGTEIRLEFLCEA